MAAENYTITSNVAKPVSVAKQKPPRVTVIIDGVKFEIDDTNADANLVEEISRVVKGLFKILEKRAQKRATA